MLRVTVCRRIYQKEFILVITLYITRLVEESLSTPFSWEGFLVYTCASLVYHSLTVLLLRVPTDAVVTATGPGIRHCDWLLRVPVYAMTEVVVSNDAMWCSWDYYGSPQIRLRSGFYFSFNISRSTTFVVCSSGFIPCYEHWITFTFIDRYLDTSFPVIWNVSHIVT